MEGIAELSFRGTAGLAEYGLRGHLVRADEQNVFRRSVRYLADERSARRWTMPPPQAGGFTLVTLLRRSPDVEAGAWAS